MMSQEQNDLITRTGPKDACGKLMRMYWQPAALGDELQGDRPVRPVKLLGENLVLFRDEDGRLRPIERHCAHRGADLAFGRLEGGGLRCAFHGWLFDVSGQCLENAGRAERTRSSARASSSAPIPVVERSGHSLGLARRRRPARLSGDRLLRGARQPHPSPSRATWPATGCRRSKSASIPRTPPICIVSSRMRTPPKSYGKQSAAPPPAATCR